MKFFTTQRSQNENNLLCWTIGTRAEIGLLLRVEDTHDVEQ